MKPNGKMFFSRHVIEEHQKIFIDAMRELEIYPLDVELDHGESHPGIRVLFFCDGISPIELRDDFPRYEIQVIERPSEKIEYRLVAQ